jgi:CHAT domain-containing protein
MAVVSGVFGGRAGWRRLPEAEEEARVLREDHGAGGIDATLPKVLAFIQGDPVVDLAHFAVHGKYDQTGAQDGLVLVDGEVLNPDQVRGADLAGAPFVFLNACQVGAGNQVLGQYGGMAAAFLYAGASAVIAPLWSVQDATARKLAVSFYQELAEQRETRPAEVFREARGRFGQAVEEGSVSYLAYQFFGHPSMKLVRQGGS